jgi:predicted esterase
MDEYVIEARTHGRYLCHPPAVPPPWPIVMGFHGFAEDADIHLEALRALPDADRWLLVAVQALHPFYTRTERVVASWMTRQHREPAIADNIDYVGRVLTAVQRDFATARPIVFAGFSQGGAMAYRAAATYACDGVLVLAADVPPDVATADHALPRVLIGRGRRDDWYTAAVHHADVGTLERRGVVVESCVFDGGHEWGDAFRAAAGEWLARLRTAGRASGARAPR